MTERVTEPKLTRRILVDTREQLPWQFEHIDYQTGEVTNHPSVLDTLGEGDYSLEGLESYVRLERKSLPDLVQTITWGRKAWCAELSRLQETIQHPFIYVEGCWHDIAEHAYRNNVKPQAVTGSVLSFMHDFARVQWVWCGTRRLAEAMAVRHFSIIERRIDKPKRQTA